MGSLKIVYEDQALMVIDKPANLVVDRSESQQSGTMEDILRDEYGINIERSGIVHRLDKDTSGLMVVAKTTQALEGLKQQFKDRTTHKEYLCLVHGLVEAGGKVDAAIKRNPGNNERFIVMEGGKSATTEYSPVELRIMNQELRMKTFSKQQLRQVEASGYGRFTLLKCQPITGRTHQIRVHLKSINHPIVSDDRYGGRKTVRLDRLWCPRQFLHAQKLSLVHPETDKPLEFNCQLPDDLKRVWDKLQSSSSN